MTLLDQLQQLPLARDRSFESQPSVLGLTGFVDLQRVTQPLVSRSSSDELGCAERVPVTEEIEHQRDVQGGKRGVSTHEIFSKESHKQ